MQQPVDSTAFWVLPLSNGDLRTVMRSEFPGSDQPISVPRELGDGIDFVAIHFSGPTSGVAVVRDVDGAGGHVLSYDAVNNAWIEAARIVEPELADHLNIWMLPRLHPHRPGFTVRSWSDGSWIAAAIATDPDTFTARLWSASSADGGAPSWTALDLTQTPLLDPADRMVFSVVGAATPSQVNAVAVASASGVSRTVFLSVDRETGGIQASEVQGATGLVRAAAYGGEDDYYLADGPAPEGGVLPPIMQYCRRDVCSSRRPLNVVAVGSFPWAAAQISVSPVPSVELADLSGVEPVLQQVTFPTPSSEMWVQAVLPDPKNSGWLRLVAFDADIEQRLFEYLYKPESGDLTPVPEAERISNRIGCIKNDPSLCFRPGARMQEVFPRSFFFTHGNQP